MSCLWICFVASILVGLVCYVAGRRKGENDLEKSYRRVNPPNERE
jgi:hypothetical protein